MRVNVNANFISLLTNFGEKVSVRKQAVIRKPLVKLRALYRSLAFLGRFTKVGHEPFICTDWLRYSDCSVDIA